MNSWIFQGNPDVFDMTEYLSKNDDILWSAKQYRSEIEVNDEVFMWRAVGKNKKARSGVIAVAKVVEKPYERVDDQKGIHLWIKKPAKSKYMRAGLKIIHRCIGAKEIIKREWIKEDPVLKHLTILKQPAGTNFKINRNEAIRLRDLINNTGRDWNRNECIAGLWAFKETLNREVSVKVGSPVAEVAMLIGRAIGGVYNKVMNYRHIDPRDKRDGLSSTNRIDHETWAEFYNKKTKQLKTKAIDAEYKKLWKDTTSNVPVVKQTYDSFGEAPNDNPAELRMFAQKVRKGQKQFRDNLLKLYEKKCSVTGWWPQNVLEAVHIWEHSKSGINKTENGLLLRADLHSLFDDRLLTIVPDTLEVIIDKSLQATEYWKLNGVILRPRTDGSSPSRKYLAKRLEEKN